MYRQWIESKQDLMEERGTIHSGTRWIIPLWQRDMQEEVEGGPGAFARCRKPDMNKFEMGDLFETHG